jgi:hypothetical protein
LYQCPDEGRIADVSSRKIYKQARRRDLAIGTFLSAGLVAIIAIAYFYPY